jgi:VWFA-related protein
LNTEPPQLDLIDANVFWIAGTMETIGARYGLKAQRAIPPSFLLCVLAVVRWFCADGQAATSQFPLQAVPSPETSVMIANAREGLVHLDVAATGHGGRPSSGLTAKDFTLLDNGVPQRIVSFAASNEAIDDTERLTEVVLVLDEVDLSPTQFEVVKAETIKYLQQNGGHLAWPTSVYGFTRLGLYASTQATTDGNALVGDVAHHPPRVLWELPPNRNLHMTPASERFKLWDRAVQTLYNIAVERRGMPGRKVLVWMGYGWPARGSTEDKDTAFASLVELSTRIREARLVVSQVTTWSDPAAFNFDYTNYVAGVRTLSELKTSDPSPRFALPVLALQSGGLVLNGSPGIVRGIEHCVEDASAFYTVSFDPPHAAQPDEYHNLNLKVGPPGISVHTSGGYYNQPVFYDQPRVPAERVTLHDLQRILDAANEKHDGELTKQLSGLELTERLSSSQLSLWMNRLRGKKSAAALATLADESVFLDPPASEILSDPAPDPDTQRQMLSRTANYLREVLPKLPDFFATRTTTEFEQPSVKERDTWKTALADQSLRQAVTEKATLLYRSGREEQDAQTKRGSPIAQRKNLNFIGAFGPLLGSVFMDGTRGTNQLIWDHWFRGENEREAVFRYTVREDPHYKVEHCCLAGGKTFMTSAEYFGELSINPETGAILRLTIESEPGWVRQPDLNPVLPVKRAMVMVEYGPVEIGGKKYICPQRSVVLMRARTVRTITFWDEIFDIYAPYETLLNDVAYSEYHKFGSETRMLPGFDIVPNATFAPAVGGQSPIQPPPTR